MDLHSSLIVIFVMVGWRIGWVVILLTGIVPRLERVILKWTEGGGLKLARRLIGDDKRFLL